MDTGLVKQRSFIHSPGPAPVGRAEGGRRVEYLLVIYPDGDLHDKLLDEQQQFLREYGMPLTIRNKPHITMAAFQAGEGMEDTLIRWIQRICGRHRSFELTLNNYSGFPPHTPWPQGQTSALYRECANFSQQRIPGTIYLRVQDHLPFLDLAQQLGAIDDFIRSSGCPPVNLIGHPYLSIAGGLTERVYSRAMPDYSRKSFHGSFRVGELVLLKRDHSFDPCKTVNVFRLLPDDTGQPSQYGQPGPLPA